MIWICARDHCERDHSSIYRCVLASETWVWVGHIAHHSRAIDTQRPNVSDLPASQWVCVLLIRV